MRDVTRPDSDSEERPTGEDPDAAVFMGKLQRAFEVSFITRKFTLPRGDRQRAGLILIC